ncbi:MAG: glycosyltransferase, partial [Candidatus Lokiarchaeota archaeon]|nr:glycosyltransferase [Candidatus Lokiarchaeota archaeon]
KSELKEKYNLANKWVVGFFGTYYDWEGLNLLIKAIYKIHQKGKSINGLFIGHGPEESKLLDLVKKFNLQDIIKFTGPINYNEIQNYINLLDIFITPRPFIKEFSFITPLKVLEVMGLKKSIIASDLPGFRKIIKNNFTGLLIEPNNIGDLVKKILILFNNPLMMKEIGENAFKFIEKNYSWKIMIKPLLKIYKKLSKN